MQAHWLGPEKTFFMLGYYLRRWFNYICRLLTSQIGQGRVTKIQMNITNTHFSFLLSSFYFWHVCVYIPGKLRSLPHKKWYNRDGEGPEKIKLMTKRFGKLPYEDKEWKKTKQNKKHPTGWGGIWLKSIKPLQMWTKQLYIGSANPKYQY